MHHVERTKEIRSSSIGCEFVCGALDGTRTRDWICVWVWDSIRDWTRDWIRDWMLNWDWDWNYAMDWKLDWD